MRPVKTVPLPALASILAIALVLAFAAASPVRAEDPPARAWVAIYNGDGNHEDIGRYVAVDSPDRIYVGASTYLPGGGGANHDYLLLQYDAEGTLVWSRRYGGDNAENLSDLIVPAPGEVVVTGIASGEAGPEVATVKYDQAGALLWDRRFPVQNILVDHGPKLAVDPDGNILVSGTNDWNYVVLKYSPTGLLLWDRAYDGPAESFDAATDIAAGPDGSAYVTGIADMNGAFATVKYSPGGVFQWEQLETGDIGSVFEPSRVEVGPDGHVVVAGSPESTCGVFQLKVWKCDAANGGVLWWDKLPAQPCDSYTCNDLDIDAAGNVAALSSGYDNGGVDSHMKVVRYAPNGTRLWVRTFDGPGALEDWGYAVTTDAAGAVYAVGYTAVAPQNRDIAAAKYAADGTFAWSVTWASEDGTNDFGHDIVVDPAGRVIVTGSGYDLQQGENVVTIQHRQTPATDVADGLPARAAGMSLSVWPNPVRDSARIAYQLPEAGAVRIDVIGPDGRIVRSIAGAGPSAAAGDHQIRWDGRDAAGARLPAGMYVVRLDAGGTATAAKVSLVP